MVERVDSYRDLKVWQMGMEIAELCSRLTRNFPKEELFGMTSQVRRASVSMPANIAEGYGRQLRGEYLHFLRIAQGSLKELETHLLLSVRVELAVKEEIDPILALCDEEGRMLLGLMKHVAQRSV